jgi:hypothetical protein
MNVDNAQVSFTSDGEATFTPSDNFFGHIVINYTVQDNAGNGAEGQWTITVIEVFQVQAKTSGGGTLHFWMLLMLLTVMLRRQYQRGWK